MITKSKSEALLRLLVPNIREVNWKMSQYSELDRSNSMRKTLRSSLTKIFNKITEQLAGDAIDYDEIEGLKTQLIENAEQLSNLYSEIHKFVDKLDTQKICSIQ